jgi:hypothetical protein
MELSFSNLVDFNIKRLARPKFKHEFPNFNDPTMFQAQPEFNPDDETEEMTQDKKNKLWME